MGDRYEPAARELDDGAGCRTLTRAFLQSTVLHRRQRPGHLSGWLARMAKHARLRSIRSAAAVRLRRISRFLAEPRAQLLSALGLGLAALSRPEHVQVRKYFSVASIGPRGRE